MTLVLHHHSDSLVGRALGNGRRFVGVKTSCPAQSQ